MRKFTALLSTVMLGAFGSFASAQSLGEVELLEPTGKYCTAFATLYFGYEEDVELVNPVVVDDQEVIMVSGEFNGVPYETEMYEASFYDYVSYMQRPCLAVYYYYVTGMENGTLTLNIPAGVVKGVDSGYLNPAQTLEFIIMDNDYNYSVTPEPNNTYNGNFLSDVTVTFDGNLTRTGSETEIYGVLNYDTDNPMSISSENITILEKEIVLNLSKLPQGDWAIIIPEGYVFIEVDGETFINPSIRIDYTIWGGMNAASVLTPEEGGFITSFEMPIEITWDYMPVSATAKGLSATFTSYSAEIYGAPIPQDAFSFIDFTPGGENNPSEHEGELSGTILRINLSSFAEYMESGYYFTVDIPAGIVESAEGSNPEQSLTFTYMSVFEGSAEMSIEGNIMKIIWPTAAELDLNFSQSFILVDANGTRNELAFYDYSHPDGVVELVNWTDVVIDLSAINLTEGDYTLVIPEGSVIIYPFEYDWTHRSINLPEEFAFSYNGDIFTGVNTVNVSDGLYRVYNLQGVNVLNTTDVNAVNELSSGIYIINGKKVAVK